MTRTNVKTKTRRAGIYLRLSHDRYGDEESTARHETDCRQLIHRRDWTVADVYRETDVSAWKRGAKRPEFDRLKADVKAGRIDAIVVWKLDRVCRNTKESLDFKNLAEQAGAEFVSVNDPGIDTTGPMGQFVFTMMSAVAQLESDIISLRVKRGKQSEAEAGRNPGGGNLPFGWKIEEQEREYGKQIRTVTVSLPEVDSKQADALSEVARRFLDDGAPLSGLAKELTARGLRTHPSKGFPNGKQLTISNLKVMLANPRLAGYRVHGNGDPGVIDLYPTTAWERIIDEGTFRRLQERFGREVVEDEDGLRLVVRGSGRRAMSKERYLLTGLMWCGKCVTERMRVMHNKKNGTRYVCRACTAVTVGKELAEEYVVKEALTLLMGRRMLGHDGASGEDVAKLETELAALRERLRDLSVARFVDGRITDDEFDAARVKLNERVEFLEGRIVQARDMRPSPIPGDVKVGFDVWWQTATLEERRQVLAGTVDRIVVAPISHDITRLFRRPDVEVDEATQSIWAGVPKHLWDEVTKARIDIRWRQEVLPPAPDPNEPFPPKAKPRRGRSAVPS